MNGFVIFDRHEAADDFFRAANSLGARVSGKLERSARDPIVLFNNVLEKDVAQMRSLAAQHGGRVQEARRYAGLG